MRHELTVSNVVVLSVVSTSWLPERDIKPTHPKVLRENFVIGLTPRKMTAIIIWTLLLWSQDVVILDHSLLESITTYNSTKRPIGLSIPLSYFAISRAEQRCTASSASTFDVQE
jgi:hypothetical protein